MLPVPKTNMNLSVYIGKYVVMAASNVDKWVVGLLNISKDSQVVVSGMWGISGDNVGISGGDCWS